jgi:hypothetical protein
MTEENFWELIDLIDWRHEPSRENMLKMIKAGLRREVPEEVEKFQEILVEKLRVLDTPDFWKATKETSGDSFLYIRLYVVGKGKNYFLNVCSRRIKMPDYNHWFEGLLSVARLIYQERTGREMPENGKMSAESFRSEAWNKKN